MHVIPTLSLPIVPTDGENARRIVRHMFWNARKEEGRAALFPNSLGKVGPYPGIPTHAYLTPSKVLLCSWSFYKRLKYESARYQRDLVDDPIQRLLEQSIVSPGKGLVDVEATLKQMSWEHDRQEYLLSRIRIESMLMPVLHTNSGVIISGLM